MTITKEDIEKSIYEYNEAIKKLEDAGIDYDNYTVTISHAKWIKLLTILKTHIEAWEKCRQDIISFINTLKVEHYDYNVALDILEIINKNMMEDGE